MMLFKMHGQRTARIKKHTVTQDHCKNCMSFDLDIKVYRDYYHFILLPIVPVGDKTAKIYCNHCGEGLRTETVRRHYENITRPPFWLYSGVILFVLLIVFIVLGNLIEQKQKATYAKNPQVGDIYLMRKDTVELATYYYLRVSSVTNDSIFFSPNNLLYLSYPSAFDTSDFFRIEYLAAFARKDIKQMLDDGTINTIEREYDEDDGFQRSR